jgi:hypothetical protein
MNIKYTLRIVLQRARLMPVVGALALARCGPALSDEPRAPTPPAKLEVVSLVGVTNEHENVKPFVVARPQGGVYVAWAQKVVERTAVLFARSADGENFDPPVRLTPEGMDLDLGAENGPNVAVGLNGQVYATWAAGSWAAAKPKLPAPQTTAKPKSTAAGGHAGHAAPRRPGNLNVWLATSTDDCQTFSEPVKVNDDPDGPEHRFATVATDAHGNVLVAWLDKRKSTTERSNFCRVFVTMSRDGGRTFAQNIDATAGQPNSICHCCRIALVTSSRGVFAAFRNEINDLRDMFFVQSPNNLNAFSKPAAMEETGWYVPT